MHACVLFNHNCVVNLKLYNSSTVSKLNAVVLMLILCLSSARAFVSDTSVKHKLCHDFLHRTVSSVTSLSANHIIIKSSNSDHGSSVGNNKKSSSSPSKRRNHSTASFSKVSLKPLSKQSSDLSLDGVRVNKTLLGLSRRSADDAIAEGRVTVNGVVAKTGIRVNKGDVVRLDGKLQQWESIATAKTIRPSKDIDERDFIYLKYYKPKGVTSTCDPTDKSNIIAAGGFQLFPQRLFTVGRLDKDSTGLILLTSDGRVNNAILSPSMNKAKVYEVTYSSIPTDDQLQRLRQGVEITAPIQRQGQHKLITAKTLPCRVDRIGGAKSRTVEITLTEGRNRQIRRMAEEVGLEVVTLHRTCFCGITLKGLSSNNWAELSAEEMEKVLAALDNYDKLAKTKMSAKYDSDDFDSDAYE